MVAVSVFTAFSVELTLSTALVGMSSSDGVPSVGSPGVVGVPGSVMGSLGFVAGSLGSVAGSSGSGSVVGSFGSAKMVSMAVAVAFL